MSDDFFGWAAIIKWLFDVLLFGTGEFILTRGKSRKKNKREEAGKWVRWNSPKEAAFSSICYLVGVLFWVFVCAAILFLFKTL